MKFEKLNEILLEYSMKDIKLPIETHFPINDFENVVPEDFHSSDDVNIILLMEIIE